MDRRRFIQGVCGLAGLGLGMQALGEEVGADVRVMTAGPAHHFFGYYAISPWNRSAKLMACLESRFQHRMPKPGETARIGLVDAERGGFEPIAETQAWNLQQGAMLHWNPLAPDRELLFNDLIDGDLASVVLDVHSGKRRVLPRPVSAVDAGGRYALSLTYGRLARLRKVVGYAGLEDPNEDDPHPDNDGVWRVDLETGQTKLLVSLEQVHQLLEARGVELGRKHLWFNHTVVSPSGGRFLFLGRAHSLFRGKETGMYTAGMADGEDLREVIPFGRDVSHFDWRNDAEIVATCQVGDKDRTHVIVPEKGGPLRPIGGGKLDFDGHCTFGPGGDWIAMDERIREPLARRMVVYNVETGALHRIGTFPMFETIYWTGDCRCDLHPRWSADGRKICIDALASDGTRQLHVLELCGMRG